MSEFVGPSATFWNFSLALYARPGVAERCLKLQNDYRLDVNLMLFCIWFATVHGRFPDSVLQSALSFSGSWKRRVVQPLRDIRTGMKTDRELASRFPDNSFHHLREQIKALELAAEKAQQQQLQRIADALPVAQNSQETTAATANFKALCEKLNVTLDDRAEDHFRFILAATGVSATES